jgi:hypothetical protein
MAFWANPGYASACEEATMTVDQRLMETLSVLPAAQRQEVLDFAEFLRLQVERSPGGAQDQLTALPVLPGRMVPGWKDAVYGER